MGFPPPSAKQARILWISVTALAIGVLLSLIILLLVACGFVIKTLSPVLLPLAIAGIIAYLLDPLVDFFQARNIGRPRAILLVFFICLMAVAMFLATVVPRMVVETRELTQQLPEYATELQKRLKAFVEDPPMNLELPDFLKQWTGGTEGEAATNAEPEAMEDEALPEDDQEVAAVAVEGVEEREPAAREDRRLDTSTISGDLLSGLAKAVPKVWSWMLDQVGRVAGWAGLLVGLALVPVYTFYFLWEKKGIERSWTDYLPVQESRVKEEIVFVLSSINYYLILFFRGQVLVALCDGALLTIGFLAIGLDFAVLLGVVAGLLSVVPFLGVVLSIVPVVILAAVQFGDWLHPILVLVIFATVQTLEGLVISPKIMGDRVGLHPLTIIIAVMVGTTLMGGILGGILAIPLTAALRVLMFRYVWKARTA